jgi:hypothetical protein
MALAAKFGSRRWPGGDPSETRAGLLPKRLNDLDVVADGGAVATHLSDPARRRRVGGLALTEHARREGTCRYSSTVDRYYYRKFSTSTMSLVFWSSCT